MAEENQVQQEPKEPQQVMKELQRVTTKDPKKVEAGKRLAAINRKKREAKKRKEQAQLERGFASGVNQYYGIGAVLAVGVIGGLWLLHLSNQERRAGRRATFRNSIWKTQENWLPL